MHVITTTETFSDATRQADLNLQDFASIPGRSHIWRLQAERLPEKIVSLVRSYNTDEDKVGLSALSSSLCMLIKTIVSQNCKRTRIKGIRYKLRRRARGSMA